MGYPVTVFVLTLGPWFCLNLNFQQLKVNQHLIIHVLLYYNMYIVLTFRNCKPVRDLERIHLDSLEATSSNGVGSIFNLFNYSKELFISSSSLDTPVNKGIHNSSKYISFLHAKEGSEPLLFTCLERYFFSERKSISFTS